MIVIIDALSSFILHTNRIIQAFIEFFRIIDMNNKLTRVQYAEIKKRFLCLSSKEEIPELIDYANQCIYGGGYKKIDLKYLTYYTNPLYSKKRYRQFSIKKKSGGERVIQAPIEGLKTILKGLNEILTAFYEPNNESFGFILGRSVVDNARLHVGKRYVYNLDLKDFFHSFDRNRVKLALMKGPFFLNKEKEPLAFLLSSLCTHPIRLGKEIKTVLPQGSPTSPILTNIICKTLDRRLKGLSKRFGTVYSRYADDITFSSDINVFENQDFLNELRRIIEIDQKLIINKEKTRLQERNYKQEVTGIIVNQVVNVPRSYLKQLRMWINFIERYGLLKAESIFFKDYKLKNSKSNKKPTMLRVLDGKLMYLRMVKGKENPVYQKLFNRYVAVTDKRSNLESIITDWEINGIESAMKLYYGDVDVSLKSTSIDNLF